MIGAWSSAAAAYWAQERAAGRGDGDLSGVTDGCTPRPGIPIDQAARREQVSRSYRPRRHDPTSSLISLDYA